MKTLTFSTGRSIGVRPAPHELVAQFIALAREPAPTAAQRYHTLMQGLALVLPYIACAPDPPLVLAMLRQLQSRGVNVQADDMVLQLIASINTPADWAQLGRALAADALGAEAMSA